MSALAGLKRVLEIRNWSLSNRMIVLYVGLSAALVAVLIGVSEWKVSAGLREQAAAGLASDALVVTDAVDKWNTQHVQALQAIAAMTVIREYADAGAGENARYSQVARETLTSMKVLIPDSDSIGIMDASGAFVLSTYAGDLGVSVPQRDYFQTPMKEAKPFISGVSISTVINAPAIFHSAPIMGRNGRPVAVVRSRSSLDQVRQFVQAAGGRVGAGGTGLLLDQDGLVIASTIDPKWILRPVVPLKPEVDQAMAQDKRWGNNDQPAPLGLTDLAQAIGIDGKRAFQWVRDGGAFQAIGAPLAATRWTYVAALPDSTVQASAADFRQWMMAVGGVALLLGAIAAALASRTVTRPLEQAMLAARQIADVDLAALTGSLEAMGRGSLGHHFEISTRPLVIRAHDEVGQLAEAFNHMLIALHSSAASFEATTGSLRGLMAETRTLTQAAIAGRLAVRADPRRFEGEYREIVDGMNATLDAVVGPLNVAAEYVDRIGKGDIPAKITDEFAGDFNEIKNNLNACLEGLAGLIESNAVLQRMAVNDYTRQVEGNYRGVFAQVADAVNEVRARLIRILETSVRISNGDLTDLDTFKRIGKRSEDDRLMPAFTQMIESIQLMVDEANRLSRAAVDGKLATRAEIDLHKGAFRQVITGVNDTLDAVIGPLNVAAEYVDRISKGEIPDMVTDEYHGDFDEIKKNLNAMLVYLGEMAHAADRIAGNDLTVRVQARTDQDRLGNAFVHMIQDLSQTLDGTSQAVTRVSASAHQVRSISRDMATVAQEQSAAVEEVTRTLEETHEQVKNSAERASVADRLVADATALADVGQTKMNALTGAMEEVESSSQEIGKIIKVINDIAFQTNLLALNAAVEAARAGEAGRGFAVVAQEVRNLAERSAQAARSTEDLIEGTRQRVSEGVRMVDATGAALAEIVTRVSGVKGLIGEIAATGREQACSLQQISAAMVQLNDGTQSSHGQSEELARTAGELASLAERLQAQVAQFKLRQAAESPDAVLHLETIRALDRPRPGELELETWQALQEWVRSNTPASRA